jgi:hypothetical protein
MPVPLIDIAVGEVKTVQQKVAGALAYGGATSAVGAPVTEYFGMTPPEISLLLQVGGFLIGLIGLAASLWFQWDKRKAYRAHLREHLRANVLGPDSQS